MRSMTLMVCASCVYFCFPINASALSNDRTFEMVSPVYKEGYGVNATRAIGPSGNIVAFTSQGGFAGALSGGLNASHDYLARRTPTGWLTESLEPAFGALADVSANLEFALATGPVGPNAGVENYSSRQEVFQVHHTDTRDTPESWEVFGGMAMERTDGKHLLAVEESASADLCHVVVGKAEGALVAAAENTNEQIYDFARGCGGESPSLALVGLNNSEAPTPINRGCPVGLGTGPYINNVTGSEQEDDRYAVDSSGNEIFFTTSVEEAACTSSHQLFVRLDGARTVEVSRRLEVGKAYGGCIGKGIPGEVPCDGASSRASAYFKGASEDGSKVYFTTSEPLVSEDKDIDSDLYVATIGCPGIAVPSNQLPCEGSLEVTSLVRASHAQLASDAAEVQGVVSVAADGSRVYFVARGVLGEEPNAQGDAPVKGADNLYVYDSVSGKIGFVAELCSGPARSSTVVDLRCSHGLTEGAGDAELWRLSSPEAQATTNGAFLVFSTFAQLVPGDADNTRDVYRYDAQTGALERVSTGVDDYDANGNGAFEADIPFGFMGGGPSSIYQQDELGTRAISDDGSRIVFSTAEPLSPISTNGRTNVYEWHEGKVSIVSTGTAEQDDAKATVTPSGQDVLFTTAQGLVSQDTDGLPDIYDARIGGGFSPSVAGRESCSGDSCQGPLTDPAPLLVPGSVAQSSGGNFAAPSSKPRVKRKVKPKRGLRRRKKSSHRSGRALKSSGRRGR